MARGIVLVVADQLRRSVLSHASAYSASTPHIDAMAEEGVSFANCVSVMPICVPARFSMWTGAYPHTRFVPGIEWRMSPTERTVAHDLADEGWVTSYIGKWHLYGGHGVLPGHTAKKANLSPVPIPFRGGFQRWFGFDVANDPFDTWVFEGNDSIPQRLDGYQTDALTSRAIEEIKELSKQDKPFFVVLSVEPPHFPLESPQKYRDSVGQREHALPPNFLVQNDAIYPGDRRSDLDRSELIDNFLLYKAMVENLDENIGRLRDAIDRIGLTSAVDFILTADHGQMDGAHGCRSIRKSYPFSESVDVPLIVSGPTATAAGHRGTRVDTPVSLIDLAPTVCGLARVPLRDVPGRLCRGVNLAPVISDRDPIQREAVYFEFTHDLRPDSGFHNHFWRAVRTEEWTYVVKGDEAGSEPWLLYNRRTDPWELRNLLDAGSSDVSSSVTKVATTLHRQLALEHRESLDHFVLSSSFGVPGANEWETFLQ